MLFPVVQIYQEVHAQFILEQRWFRLALDCSSLSSSLVARKQLLGRAGRGPYTFWPLWAAPISGPPTFELHLNNTHYITEVLHSHYNVSTSTDIENGIVCCGSVHNTRVDGFTARVRGPSTRVYNFFPPSKSWLAPDVLLH